MSQQIPLDKSARADDPEADDDGTHVISPDLAYKRLTMVNVVFCGIPGGSEWVLIDTGIPGSGGPIAAAAARRYGADSRPLAIILTHGHFDHVSSAKELSQLWNVPVYAHPLEHPYLDGTAAYPPPDPSVGGGFVSLLSPMFPSSPIDLGSSLRELPADGSLPGMPNFRWIHTPGHSPGHVSFWRETDGVLIAGDAFITTRMESVYSVITQEPEMHGPPQFLTPDWDAARESVRRLADLEPTIVITGHGRPMRGPAMRDALSALARDFDRIAVPSSGRYVLHPSRPQDGTAYRDPSEAQRS